jgi:2-iminobutanoate/2-iminopropanoate deaminase
MDKKIIATKDAPQAIGPYSQAVVFGNFIFISGQIPIIPKSGELILGGIEEQTEQVLKNLEAILKSSHSSLINVLKTTVFITDLNDFGKMNKVYEKFFKDNPPARSTVEVSRLPKEVLVEIEAIAYIP